MSKEFELIGVGALGALLRRKAKHAPPLGTLCPNCGTPVVGAFCHHCGQSTDDQHRSIWRLAWEGVEGLTHLDGRLGQTLPSLFFNPGKLARDHLEGRRQRHVPPFRLFLISLLIFMFVLEGVFHRSSTSQTKSTDRVTTRLALGAEAPPAPGGSAPPQPGIHLNFSNPPVNAGSIGSVAINEDGEKAMGTASAHPSSKGQQSAFSLWFKPRLQRALENREYYTIVLFTWAHRLAILLLPILAGLLALVYVRRRKFYVYDHLIIAMQFLSFEFLVFAIAWVIPGPAGGFALLIATLWTPVNLFMTLRGAYGSKWYTAAIKTVFLWFSTLALFLSLMLGLFALALAEM